jgi:hypothetical protein
MRWNDANTWVENLDFGGYSDWRLPWVSVSAGLGSLVTNPVNCNSATELECRDNEMGYMGRYNFASLGAVEVYNVNGEGWTGTEFGCCGFGGSVNAVMWGYRFIDGFNDQAYGNEYGMLAWAVRSGDVSASGPGVPPAPVSNRIPEPGTFALLCFGLAGLGTLRHGKPI